jgi:hypothetical protein
MGTGYDGGLNTLPVELTEDVYHLNPKRIIRAVNSHQRNHSTDNVYNNFSSQPNPSRISSARSSGANMLKEYN